MQVDASGADAAAALGRVPGVTRVVEVGPPRRHGRLRGRQRAAAATCAATSRAPSSRSGWGLLELRPMRMSLEDIFLSLTTDETPAADAAPEAEGAATHA